MPTKNRQMIYEYLFKEGVLVAKKDFQAPKHPEIEVPNLQVIKTLQVENTFTQIATWLGTYFCAVENISSIWLGKTKLNVIRQITFNICIYPHIIHCTDVNIAYGRCMSLWFLWTFLKWSFVALCNSHYYSEMFICVEWYLHFLTLCSKNFSNAKKECTYFISKTSPVSFCNVPLVLI